jgi:hypothetical protein
MVGPEDNPGLAVRAVSAVFALVAAEAAADEAARRRVSVRWAEQAGALLF